MNTFVWIGCLAGLIGGAMNDLPLLKVQGKSLVDPQGQPVTLKGANLGNWLVIEMWMLGLSELEGNPEDQYALEELLTKRFGEEEKDRLMDVYRSSWLTERDFQLIPSFGFNLVRLPMNYRLMEDDRRPFELKKDAWRWIDRAIDLSERNGLYVILDMHGAQGGQSPYDHTGHSNQNRLKDDEQAQKRLAWLWGEIAKRYRNRSAVLAYDVFNEPYGMPKDIQVKVFKMAYHSIRAFDPDKLIFAHGNYDDFQHYGDPKTNGWRNVGFQMHYYPGLFGGGPPTVRTHVRHLAFLDSLRETVDRFGVPFLIGEMNVVFESAGGASMMQRYFEKHARNGWMTTMWSWKTISREGGIQPAIWGATVNAEPMRKIDFRTAKNKEIEDYFRGFATDRIAVYEDLRNALTGRAGPPPELPAPPPRRESAPRHEMPGWQLAELGGARLGGLELKPDGAFRLYGGGSDVWASSDQASFLHQPIEGDFVLEVLIDDIEDVHQYAKAGLMLRSGLEADAAAAILTSFPSGEVQLAHRDAMGQEMAALPTKEGSLPSLRLRLTRQKGAIEGAFSIGEGPLQTLGTFEDRLPRRILAGVLALSHDNGQLVKIEYRNLTIKRLHPS